MARGRFISRSIITDRGIHELSSDTCRLAFTWLITTADREGRTVGEPELLISLLFPRRRDITPEMMEGFIQEWIDAGFVLVYQASDGDRYFQFINFDKHQVGLRKEREPQSEYESPNDCRIIAGSLQQSEYESPDDCRIIAGSLQQSDAEMRVNINVNDNVNVNSNENENENGNNSRDLDKENVFAKVWEKETGTLVTNFFQFFQMIEEFEKVGVTPEIYRQAIVEQKQSNYAVNNPTSVKTWAIGMVTQKRDQRKPKAKPVEQRTADDYRKAWGVTG